jgi:hypothetical protein
MTKEQQRDRALLFTIDTLRLLEREKEALINLCFFDPRNPNNIIDEFDKPRTDRKEKCYCDNCFYGRDKLALEILRLQKYLDKE